MSLSINIQGDKAVILRLEALKRRVQNRVIRRAATAALKPMVADARARCPSDSGNLKKSLGVIVLRRKGTTHRFRVGPRKGFKHETINEFGKKVISNPENYAVPVEYGHVVVLNKKQIGYVAPAGFLRGAYEAGRARLVDIFAQELRSRIEKAEA